MTTMNAMMMTAPSFRGLSGGARADATPNAILAELQVAVKAMRDELAADIQALKKGQEDVVRSEKIERINADVGRMQAEVDRLNVLLAASSVGAGGAKPLRDAEYSQAFAAHFRRGDVQASLNKGVASEGGHLAPVEWDRTIIDKLRLISPMRQVCGQISISGAGFSKLFNQAGTTSGWVGETAARPTTNTPTFGTLTYTPMELYANPNATQQMLDDAEIDLESWLAGEVETEFARAENLAFVSGAAATQPKGIMTYVTGGANAAEHPYGAILLTNSGLAAAIAADPIIDLIYALPQAFQGNARFGMNRNTLAVVRKLKDGDGNYLWQPSYQAGQPSQLAGYPVTEIPDMPNIAANAVPILFGDFQRTYLIVDRIGTRVLRDPFTNKPYVQFYTTKRVGGGLLNPETMRGLRCAV
ncbi:MAG: phage major capsid protein [Gemmatimonadales bacterium]|nr:phage major capsid protein [Gemmatimonadales bacterium]